MQEGGSPSPSKRIRPPSLRSFAGRGYPGLIASFSIFGIFRSKEASGIIRGNFGGAGLGEELEPLSRCGRYRREGNRRCAYSCRTGANPRRGPQKKTALSCGPLRVPNSFNPFIRVSFLLPSICRCPLSTGMSMSTREDPN